ncbi:hypothetical protein DPMN_164526 [Dreissena polymorpha]|uniref:EGF-like calcium-binding domain-containing protein n=1 Tax=Dreissena polymorpha TaxID=45954 RepID=A0A9D4EVD4_DREPO|nr:hypothetical protein DPMN_164526 [Dreissena polymorpha]
MYLQYASLFTDIDECAAKTSDCKQKCDNTPGGYQCGCWAGARLYTSSQVVMLGTTVLVPNVSCYSKSYILKPECIKVHNIVTLLASSFDGLIER